MEKNTIQLSGFNPVERQDATIAVTKFTDKLKSHFGDFDELLVVKKDVHAQGIHGSIEVNANLLVKGKRYHGHSEAHTLKEVLDQSLGSLMVSMEKHKKS